MKKNRFFEKVTHGLAGRLMMLLTLLLIGGAGMKTHAAKIPWVKYENNTLTFYYSEKKTLDTDEYELNSGSNSPKWYGFCNSIQKVVFTESFKEARPTTCYSWFNNCQYLTTIEGIENLNTSEVTDMRYMFFYCQALQSLNLSSFKTEKVTNMIYMFYNCRTLQSLDLSGFNTEKVTNMGYMFSNCSALQSLNLSSFNTANVTDMRFMFYYCKALTSLDLSSFNTANVTNMGYMFSYCQALQSLNLSSFNTAKVTNMGYMFSNCSALTSLDLSNFNTANVTDMYNMFAYCQALQSLNLSNFNTANVTNMGYMFSHCQALQSLNLSNFNTANVTIMYTMFFYCQALQSLDLSSFNTEKVTGMGGMFACCSALKTIYVGKDFTKNNQLSDGSMFADCSAQLYSTISDYMAHTGNKTFGSSDGGSKTIKPYFPINANAVYGTLCSPVGGTLEAGTFYGFDKLYEVNEGNSGKTWVSLTEVSKIEAGKPYIYHRNATDNDPIANVILFDIDETTAEAPQTNGMLKGTFERMTAPNGSYILQSDGKFHHVADDNNTLNVGAYRAYLDLDSKTSGAKLLSLSFDNMDATGIKGIEERKDAPVIYYDIMGRRVTNPVKGGLYIVNGKKVIK